METKTDAANKPCLNEDDADDSSDFIGDNNFDSVDTINADVILSAKEWPKDIVPKYGSLKDEILSHHAILEERQWVSINMECTKALKMSIETRDGDKFNLSDTGITMHQLIALRVFIGDYRFESLQNELMAALNTPFSDDKLRSLVHWKSALKNVLLLITNTRKCLCLKGPVVFYRNDTLEETLMRVFGSYD